jgi:hypothetical protein
MTIEQIMFKKFHLFLKAIYNKANGERDLAFKTKLKAIQMQSPESIFDFLEVKQKFRLTPKSDVTPHGYQYAVDELNKLGYLEHPYDKLVFSLAVFGQNHRSAENPDNGVFQGTGRTSGHGRRAAHRHFRGRQDSPRHQHVL